MTTTTFGKRLKIARERAGWTQKEASERLGITDKSLSRYENDTTFPDYETLSKLAMVYNVSNDWLLGYTEEIGQAPKQADGSVPQRAKGAHGKLDELSPESKKKAEEYIEMLLTLDQVKEGGGGNSIDFNKNVS